MDNLSSTRKHTIIEDETYSSSNSSLCLEMLEKYSKGNSSFKVAVKNNIHCMLGIVEMEIEKLKLIENNVFIQGFLNISDSDSVCSRLAQFPCFSCFSFFPKS